VLKGPHEVKNPYPEDSAQGIAFVDQMMNAGHGKLK
jgi:hypothetical protein